MRRVRIRRLVRIHEGICTAEIDDVCNVVGQQAERTPALLLELFQSPGLVHGSFCLHPIEHLPQRMIWQGSVEAGTMNVAVALSDIFEQIVSR